MRALFLTLATTLIVKHSNAIKLRTLSFILGFLEEDWGLSAETNV